MKTLALILVFGLGLASAEKVVCYFGSWATWRPGDGKFDVEDIDPFLCTHVIFGFAGLSNHTWEIEVLDPWNELCPSDPGGNNCAYDRFVALKQKNPELKVILAVGGWNEGSEDYSVMANDAGKRKTFIDSTLKLIQEHKFDGLDMDWEYPTQRGGGPEDRENFITLLTELRERFVQYNPPLMLTGAVHCCKPTVDQAYDVKMYDLLDQLHIMSYDMHGAWENFTHHNAPLCTHRKDTGDSVYFSVVESVNYHLSLGAPKDKMVMGIPVYGRCFTLDDPEHFTMFSPAHKPGPAGPYIRIPGTLGFNEICERLMDDTSCTYHRDFDMYEPYFHCKSDSIWCGFDDAESVYKKATYAKNMGLSGVLVWTIDTDDFRATCYHEDFHLLREIRKAVNEPPNDFFPECQYQYFTTTPPPTTTTTTVPTTTTTEEPTTTSPPPPPTTTTTPTTPAPTTTTPPTPSTTPGGGGNRPRPNCNGVYDGTTFPHEDCNKYWVCVNGQSILEQCGPGTLFDEILHICNWEDNVDTSNCNLWICEVDNTYYPHADCDKYYWCYDGSPHTEQCPNGLYWNQYILQCDLPIHVDTSKCNIV